MRSTAIGLALVLAAGPAGRAPAPEAGEARGDDRAADEAARAARMAADEVPRWSIRVGAAPGLAATTGPDPVLRYTNPGVGRVHGSVYLFVAEGRPAAVLSIYKWFSPWTGFEAELQSLATTPLRGSRDGRVAWQPDRPGIELRDVPGAPPPAASAAERLGQIRAIAGGFAGHLVDGRVGEAGEDQALRLLPRPIDRPPPRDQPLGDGGLFAFVLGTDPEVFLLVEAGDTPEGPRWRYGLARLNSDPLRVAYRGQEVWKVEKVADRYDPGGTYFSRDLPQGPPPP